MNNSTGSVPAGSADFLIGEWLVQPSLNRLTLADKIVQLEPKLMDVLVFLATRSGDVVSKIDITDQVWPDTFITESVITRSIAGLRRAFGDDVRNPRFIETISKRGYRLIAEVGPAPGPSPPGHSVRQPCHRSPTTPSTPFVVGQWVRGESFYGRFDVIEEILNGNRNWIWLLGTRRIGKTSVLKQLELAAATTPDLGFVPVFWDLQGADRPEELHLDFAEALLDAEDRLAELDIEVPEIRSDDCFESLGRLRRKLLARNLKLLLLCDEVEELIHLNREDPSLLRKLRRALQSRDGIRSVLASSGRLWQLASPEEDTSPFLDGFTPPLALGTLNDDEAESLILQDQLPEASQPRFPADQVDTIGELCGNHPYLIQLLCRRLLDHQDLETAVDGLAADRAVSFFFAVDFELLSDTERAIMLKIAREPGSTVESLLQPLGQPAIDLAESLASLAHLGLIRRNGEDGYSIANTFLHRWLQQK